MTATKGQRPANDSAVARRQPDEAGSREQTNLDHRYGQIGISAVAAALYYTADSKKSADDSVANKIDWRFVEVAA